MAEGIKIGAAFIEVSADLTEAEKDVNRLRKNVNGSSTTLNVNADTLMANGQIALAARSRFVDLNLRVNGLASVGKSLAALSGGAAVGKILGNVGDKLKNIPANIPGIAMTSIAIGTLGAASMASLGGIISLGGGLASVAGAGLALPGMMAGFAVGAGVLVAALKDAPTVLADLGPAFSGLQDSISSNFWDQAAAPIRTMVTSLLPQLSDGLGGVASSLGSFFGEAASALQNALGVSALGEMLANLTQSIDIAKGAIVPLVESFTTLGAVGSDYLPKLAAWFVTISGKFNEFIQAAAADGRLRGWIDGGIAGLQTLGSIVGSVASIFGGLFTAAQAAGGSGLTGLADGLAKIAAIVNGPAFQGALTTVFQGAAAGMSGLSAALGPVGDMFVALAPTIANVMTIAGQLAGQVLGGLAAAISQPAFATGLTSFFEGIQTGVQAILPHLPTLGALFGQLMGVVGQLAAVVGPVLGAALGALAPVFSTILTAIQPLIPILGAALIQIITALSPLLTILGTLFAQIAPIIGQVVAAVAPLITQLAGFLIPTIQMLMPIVTLVFSVIATVITSAMGIIQGVIKIATGLISGNWKQVWDGIKQVLSGIWNTIVAVVKGALTIVGAVVKNTLNTMRTVFTTIFNGIAAFVSAVFNRIVSFISGAFRNAVSFVSSGVNNIRNFISSGFNAAVGLVSGAFSRISSAVSNGINNAVSFVSGLPGRVLGALGNLGSTLYNSGKSLIEGFISGIKDMAGNIGGAVSGILEGARRLFPFSPAKEGPFSGKGYTTYSGKALAVDFAKSIKSQSGLVQDAASGLLGMASSQLSGGLSLNANAGIGSSGAAGSHGIINNTSTNSNIIIENISIDAKNVREFNDVINMLNDIKRTARTGRGMQNARVI